MLTKYRSTKRAGWLALSFILSVGVVLTTLPAAYAVPMMTNYQGTLKDSKGKLLNNSVVTLTFAVYEVPAGGTALWTETHSGVSVKDGAFSVVLGSVVSIPESVAQGERYLGVTVNTDAEMIPRQALVSGFFAMRAGVAESVVSGGVTTDQLGSASVTSEKVADGAVGSAKLSAGAVTSDKLAVGSVTTDQIANGAVTSEKLSAEVQEKLAQTGQVGVPATVATLNVTEKLKVGTNSLYLGSSTSVPGSTNEIYTDGGNLLLQSNAGNTNNTVISANADNTGKVGIGTTDPKTKLDVKGAFSVSPEDINAIASSVTNAQGLVMFDTTFDGKQQGEIAAKNGSDFHQLTITGNPLLLNDGDTEAGKARNVGIGTKTNTLPKNKLDVAGAVAIGSGYAGVKTAQENGLIVQGQTFIGTSEPYDDKKLHQLIVGGTGKALFKGSVDGDLADFVNGQPNVQETASIIWAHYSQPQANNAMLIEAATAGDQKFAVRSDGSSYIKGNVGVGILPTSSGVKLEVKADPNTTALHLYDDDGENEWGYAALIKVTSLNTKAIAVRKEKWNEWSGPDKFVVMGSGDVFARSFIPQSDVGLKEDIEPLENSLQRVLNLRGVSFRFKDSPEKDKPKEIGVIAQEVERVVPEVVKSTHEGIKHVNYQNLVALLIESTKEQQSQIEQLKAQNDALKTIVCKDHPEETICK